MSWTLADLRGAEKARGRGSCLEFHGSFLSPSNPEFPYPVPHHLLSLGHLATVDALHPLLCRAIMLYIGYLGTTSWSVGPLKVQTQLCRSISTTPGTTLTERTSILEAGRCLLPMSRPSHREPARAVISPTAAAQFQPPDLPCQQAFLHVSVRRPGCMVQRRFICQTIKPSLAQSRSESLVGEGGESCSRRHQRHE